MAATPGKILIVDDEPNIRKGLRAILARDGHDVRDVSTAEEALRRDEPVSLTPTEYQLLLVLARRKGEAIDYVTLAQLVLEYEAELWEAKELIKRHVFALRQKIEPDPAQPAYVVNVRSVGYRLDVPES